MRDIMRIKSTMTPEAIEAMNKVKALGNEMWEIMQEHFINHINRFDSTQNPLEHGMSKSDCFENAQSRLQEAVMWFSKAMSDELKDEG